MPKLKPWLKLQHKKWKKRRRKKSENPKLLPKAEKLYYRLVLKNGETYGGFKNNLSIGGINTAPDWDPNRSIGCGCGLHIVSGHPIKAMEFLNGNIDDYIMFEVTPIPNPPAKCGGKYRCESLINKRIIGRGSPEMSRRTLIELVEHREAPDVVKNVIMIFANRHDQQALNYLAQSNDSYLRHCASRALANNSFNLFARIRGIFSR